MAQNLDYFLFLIIATSVFVVLAASFVALFGRYKKRIFRQFAEAQKAKEAYQTELLRSNIETQENERRRFARDLHDELGSILSMLKMKLLQAQSVRTVKNESNQLLQVLAEATHLTEAAMASARRVSHELLPSGLKDFGLLGALEDFINANQNVDLRIHLNSSGISERFSTSIEVNVYRMVMELISNAVKHGDATVIDIQLTQTEGLLIVTQTDNGKGFKVGSPEHTKGLGLKNMESRSLHLNGRIEIVSSPGKGTRVIIEVPLHTANNPV